MKSTVMQTNYYYYKSTDYSDASLKLQEHFTYKILKKKRWYSSQKSVVRQVKQMGFCLPPKKHQRRGGPDLCWQTVPRPLRCHRKGAVAKSYTTSRRHQQRSRVGRAKMATSDVGRRLSARYAGAVPCTQWYARVYNRNWIRSDTRNQ